MSFISKTKYLKHISTYVPTKEKSLTGWLFGDRRVDSRRKPKFMLLVFFFSDYFLYCIVGTWLLSTLCNIYPKSWEWQIRPLYSKAFVKQIKNYMEQAVKSYKIKVCDRFRMWGEALLKVLLWFLKEIAIMFRRRFVVYKEKWKVQ